MSCYNIAASAEETMRRVWINDGDGLRNGSFEHWVEGEPLFWKVSPEFKALLSKKPTYPKGGNTALGFRGNCEDCWAATELKFDRPPAGLTLLFTFQANTSVADGLEIFVDPDDMKGRSSSRQVHPGDGRWHGLEQAITFPMDFSATRINVGFRYASQSEDNSWSVLDSAAVHVLPDPQNNPRELIRDTRFRYWTDGVPIGWRVITGNISHTVESPKEASSLRFEAPGDPDEEVAKIRLPLQLFAIDSGKTLRIQLATKRPQHFLDLVIYGRVEGKMVRFAHGTRGTERHASIPPSEEWSETTTDFLVPEKLESQSALLWLSMKPSVTQPVDIQRISAVVLPVGTDE